MKAARFWLVAAGILLLAGCSTIGGWFGGRSGDALKPAELSSFAATAAPQRLWSVDVGSGEDELGARQAPAVDGGRVFAAAVEGGVTALDLQSGQAVWHHDSELRLSGGPGAGEGLVVAGSLEGDVVALDAATGAQRWTAKVGNEILAAPVIGQGVVLVRSIDGRVTAFDADDGNRLWFWERETPSLSVRGSGSPLLGPGLLFVGSDDGTLSAISLADGRLLWEQTVAAPEGRTELDRMADIDGTPALEGTTIYATSYKGRTMAVDGPSGRPLWAHGAGGPGEVALGLDKVAVTSRDGTVWGLDKATGTAMWQQDGLLRRNVSAPAVQGEYAVVGDYEGYLHWLRLGDGAFAARVDAAGDPIRATPVVADGILLVQSTGGEVSAWRIGAAP